MSDPEKLAHSVMSGDRRALSRAITLVESRRSDEVEAARKLMDAVLPATGRACRVGVTGLPGSGKSTLIDRIGCMLVDRGERVSVLAVDPTSEKSGGSILGDKTRMAELSRRPEAFVRPSPSGGVYGGVAPRTMDALLLCEAAGYTTVFVETLGVGQGEQVVANLVDVVLCVTLAGGGDELQAIKRGLSEICDAVAFNKADGENQARVKQAARDYELAQRAKDVMTVHAISARSGAGVPELWRSIESKYSALRKSGLLAERRAQQQQDWFSASLNECLLAAIQGHPALISRIEAQRQLVRAGKLSAHSAVQRVLDGVELVKLPGA